MRRSSLASLQISAAVAAALAAQPAAAQQVLSWRGKAAAPAGADGQALYGAPQPIPGSRTFVANAAPARDWFPEAKTTADVTGGPRQWPAFTPQTPRDSAPATVVATTAPLPAGDYLPGPGPSEAALAGRQVVAPRPAQPQPAVPVAGRSPAQATAYASAQGPRRYSLHEQYGLAPDPIPAPSAVPPAPTAQTASQLASDFFPPAKDLAEPPPPTVRVTGKDGKAKILRPDDDGGAQ